MSEKSAAAPLPHIDAIQRPGHGTPLLLLHGIGRNGRDLAPLRPWIADRPTIVWNHRGHGGSQRAARYLALDYAGDVIAWLRTHATEPIDLYGHSLGAIVALRVAAEAPDKVRSIVLEDPPSPAFVASIRDTTYFYTFTAMQQLAGSAADVETIAAQLAAVRLGDRDDAPRLGAVRDAASLRFSARCLQQVDPRVFDPVFDGTWFEGYDFLATAAAVTCPTLLLHGEVSSGGMLPAVDAQTLSEKLARGVTVKLSGAGHLLHWQRLEETVRYALNFWESL